MSWFDDLIKKLPKSAIQIVNDSKTPSGKAHVGSLRGVLIHDAAYRVLKQRGFQAEYTFGVDDYDPLDEIPYGHDEYYKSCLGMPLCNVPAPPGAKESDIAMHYIKDFFNTFDTLGIKVKKYHLRDIYRSGEFNEAIDAILKKVEVVREVYLKVSKSQKPANWYPFQVICEHCGRLGTTEVTGYDGKEVIYECKPDLVTWAVGCGNKGKVSPFDGKGKLPWKLEWAAKWAFRNITIEGAGKDHNSRGGSREVASACLRQIFHKQPPLNIPYGFLKLGGAKMSSSKGIGASASDMTDFMPPQILRYLMLGTPPKRELNFAPTNKYVTQLFNGFDRLKANYHSNKSTDYDRQVYELSEIFHKENYYVPNLSLIITLVQLPHIDIYETIKNRKGEPLTGVERKVIDDRIKSARYWLTNYATEEEKFELCETLPESSLNLSVVQKAFLSNLAERFKTCEWNEESIQTAIFDVARITPAEKKEAFLALYTVLLDNDAGPKAGNLLSCLDRDFLIKRLGELRFDRLEFWLATAIQQKEFEEWLAAEREKIIKADMNIGFIRRPSSAGDAKARHSSGVGVFEFSLTMDDNKTYMKRVLFSDFKGAATHEDEAAHFEAYARDYITSIVEKYKLD